MTEQDFSRRLEHEVAAWLQESLITDAQAKTLLERYGGAAPPERRTLAGTLAFMGAILLGIGVIVFFASNWQSMPSWSKLALIFASVILSYVAGYRLRYGGTTFQGTGDALLFLGALLYGAGLFLIAQGYHVNAAEPFLLLLWIVGVLPLAYLLHSRAMVVLSLLILCIALGWETSRWLDDFDSWHEVPSVFLVFGCLLYALGNLQSRLKATRLYQQPFCVMGLWILMGALFLKTFPDNQHLKFALPLNVPEGAVLRFWGLAGLALVIDRRAHV